MSARRPSDPCPRCGQPHVTRHGHVACTGHKDKPDGRLEPCANPPLNGQDVCRYHGGAAAQNRAAGARRLEQERASRELARLGQPKAVDPGAALLDLVHWTAGEVEFWRQKVVALADADESLTWGRKSKVKKTSGQWPGTDTTFAAGEPVEYRLMVDASNRLADYSARALKAGIQEREVRIQEQQGALIAVGIRNILEALWAAVLLIVSAQFGTLAVDAQDALAKAWNDAMAQIVPRELRRIAGGEA